jgi:hypothetical protein
MQQECINQMLVKNNYRPPEVGGAIAKRVERDGSVGFPSRRQRTEIGREDHEDWMRRASRMLDEDGPAGRGVERLLAGWLRFADAGLGSVGDVWVSWK